MLKVVCFGEALVDMLSSRVAGEPAGDELERFSKFPGGAPANVAVAVAKLGGNAYFAGMLGEDMFGHFLHDALAQQGVRTDYVRFTAEAKTALAFVSLDSQGERSFEFYRPPAADLCFREFHFDPATFSGAGILHLCSNSLTDPDIAETTMYAARQARQCGWLVSVDVNLRHNLWRNGEADTQCVVDLLGQAGLVKLSREELDYLARGNVSLIRDLLAAETRLVLVTDGPQPVHWYSRSGSGTAAPVPAPTVDATAAGDAFIGGFIYQLAVAEVSAAELQHWTQSRALAEALEFACACGAHAVSCAGAFPSLPTQQSLQQFMCDRNHHA